MKRGLMMLALIGSTLIGSLALAQEQPRDRGDRGERGERRQRMDPAQMRQAMMDRLKEQLRPTDEEWQVLQPMIEKVNNAQRAARAGGGARGPRGGGDQAETELQRASRELREAVQNDSSNEAVIQQRLNAYRAAREKAEAELAAARKELQEVLTPRQEAVLVTMGMLE